MSCSVRIVDLRYSSSVPVNTWTKVDYTYVVDSLPRFSLGVLVVRNSGSHRFRIRHMFGDQWIYPGQEVVVDEAQRGTYSGSFELLFEMAGTHEITVLAGCENQESGAIQYTDQRTIVINAISPTPTPPPPPPPPTPTPTPTPPPLPPPPEQQGVPWWFWLFIGAIFAVAIATLITVIVTKRKE